MNCLFLPSCCCFGLFLAGLFSWLWFCWAFCLFLCLFSGCWAGLAGLGAGCVVASGRFWASRGLWWLCLGFWLCLWVIIRLWLFVHPVAFGVVWASFVVDGGSIWGLFWCICWASGLFWGVLGASAAFWSAALHLVAASVVVVWGEYNKVIFGSD